MKINAGFVTAFLAAFLVAPHAVAQEKILIGGSFDLSGAAADVGKEALDGAQYAIDVVNKRGGVLGKQIELRYQDNGTNSAKAVDQALDLIRGGIKFMMLPMSSASAIAVSKTVSAKAKMPSCVSTSNSDDLTIKEFHPYVFEIGPNSYMEARAVAARLAKLPYKRYAVISADYAGGRANADRFKEFIKEFNPQTEIVVEEYPKFGATDYTASINKILAAKPDYVWTILFSADLITFSKQAQALGFFEQVNNKFIALYDGATLKTLGSNAAVGTEGYQRAPFNFFAKSPEGKQYIEGFKTKVGKYPSDFATLGYDCVMTWAHAAEVAKSTDADAVIKAIEDSEFKSPRGSFRFGKFDHQGEVPDYIGKVVVDKEFGQAVLEISDVIPASVMRPSEETVKKLRGG